VSAARCWPRVQGLGKVVAAPAPGNKLSEAERARILAVVNSDRFVDLPPIQIYAQLLDEGVYLGSISTIYRVLAANAQVKERRRLARHPARASRCGLIARHSVFQATCRSRARPWTLACWVRSWAIAHATARVVSAPPRGHQGGDLLVEPPTGATRVRTRPGPLPP